MPRFSRISWKSRDDAEPPRMRVEQRGGEAAPVGARDPGRADADVVLLGVACAGSGRSGAAASRAGCGGAAPWPGAFACLRSRLLEARDEVVVLEVPGRGDDDVAGRRTSAGGRSASARRPTRRDHVGGADHRPAERMVAEDRLAHQVVHELLRRVLVHRDLLEHDLALGVELRERAARRPCRSSRRAPCSRWWSATRDVDERVLARGGRVQLAAQPVEDLGDLLRGVASACP